MTILQSLAKRYYLLAQSGEVAVAGFSPAQISFAIVLDRQGNYVATEDMRTSEGKKLRPQSRLAPAAPKRTVGIASGAFWDKTSYVFGVTALDETATTGKQAKDAARLIQEHAAFLARHEALLASTEDDGCAALLHFLRQWSPDRYDTLEHAAAMLDQNVAFRLKGEPGFIHDRPAARAALLAEAGGREPGAEAMCLVTGKTGPIARLHPSIKGVRGAQSSGAALVSFNLDSFTSYGKVQGANAPVSEDAAFAYSTALNALLAPSHTTKERRPGYQNRVGLGQTTVLFWAEHGDAEALARGMIAGGDDEEIIDESASLGDATTETTKMRAVLTKMEKGERLWQAAPQMDPQSRVYILGLSPNAARLSVRFWLDETLENLSRNFQFHWQDIHIEPRASEKPPTVWRLLLELAPQRESENIPAHLSGELMRAILHGLPYPRALLIQTIMRIRADGEVSALRVALAKAVVTRSARRSHAAALRENPELPAWKDPLMSLDRDESNVGYRLGRLFALLDYAQYLSDGSVNAGVKEKFFASASSTPRRIFPSLLRMSQNHLCDARKDMQTRDRALHTDAEIKQVMDGLEAHTPFPTTLSLDDQSRFIVGFYHQRPTRRGAKPAEAALTDTDKES